MLEPSETTCDQCVEGFCGRRILVHLRVGERKTRLRGGVARRSGPLSIRKLVARIPTTGAAAKDLVCDVANRRPCRHAADRARISFNEQTGEFLVDGTRVRLFTKRCRQAELLQVFQSQGWPSSIKDSLGSPSAADPENGLSDIVRELNRKQLPRKRVHFWCEGRSVFWGIMGDEPGNQ
jgi:hypothetical protein